MYKANLSVGAWRDGEEETIWHWHLPVEDRDTLATSSELLHVLCTIAPDLGYSDSSLEFSVCEDGFNTHPDG